MTSRKAIDGAGAAEYSRPVTGGRVLGLDSLRIFALFLVTWQHAASVFGAYAETQWHGISPGQTGVGLFCAISGYLAFRAAPANTANWFGRRLLSIFPSYWIVTVLAFAMTMIVGSNKPITFGLFASQMLGLGYFTHGWELVNVVSWFISLILLCYAFACAARQFSNPGIFWGLIVILALVAVTTRTEVALSRHVLAFALGALYSLRAARPSLVIVAAVLVGVGIWIDEQVFYSGFALLALSLAEAGWIWEPHIIRRVAAYTYEYFLVHGICLVAAARFIPSVPLSILVAVTGACGAAVALHYLDAFLKSQRRVQLLGKP